MILVPILRSGILAEKFCRDVSRANVEAVFERCFYLRSGDAFICVGGPDIGKGPLTLIGSLGSLPKLGLQPGGAAAICERHITIGNSVRFTLDRAESWRAPAWPISLPRIRLINACNSVARRAAIDASQETFAHRAFRARIAAFERCLPSVLAAEHVPSIVCEEAVRGLIGLGPGLTPSGDDFLVGALALLDAIGERDAHAALARAIIDVLPGSTAPLSACFLRAAAAGHVGKALHCAVSSVITGDVDAAIAAVENIGHSSGWDMMAGIATTLRVAAAARLGPPLTVQAFALS
jgi:hypothetical protein